MKTNEENRGIPNWMRYKSTSIDLSGSETYLFPGAFYGNRHIERCVSLTDIYLPLCIGNIAANAFKGCPENIRFHVNSPIINPEKLKQHIEKELGRSIELYDSTGNVVTVSAGANREICNL